MKTEIKKFLDFNGKSIFFVAADGQYWIAIKPICEALGVDYERQRKNLKEDEILAQLPSEQAVVAADGRVRKMLCLPEFYVYGWIFNIQSSSPELLKYKWECYRILYEHFHGTITGRQNLLRQKAQAQLEIEQVFSSLGNENAIRFDRARRKINQINARLRELDGETLEEERNLFNS
jgi:prophage antirepressor-like protein